MAKFRKRPVIIDAFQWHGESVENCEVVEDRYTPLLKLSTLEGPMYAAKGDWIITGVKGETYSCKPDIFELTYEPVES